MAPPDQFSAERFRSMLLVPWHRERPWKEGEVEPPVRSWQDQSETVGDVADAPDETGVVSGIEEHEGAPA
jgi:hypothetical protein